MGNTSSSANPRQQHHPSSSISSSPSQHNPDSPRRASSSRRSRSHTPASNAHRSHLSQSTTHSPNDGPAPRSPSLAPAPTQTDPPASDALNQQQQGQTTHQENNNSKKLPHRSLRTKKRSLELPDLALALTPAASVANGMTSTAATAGAVLPNAPAGAGVRRPQASSPIAIPNRVGAAPSSAASQAAAKQAALQERERERMRQIPTAAVELAPSAAAAGVAAGAGRGRGVNAHIRGAPLQYNSTRSFAGTTGRSGGPGATYTGSNGQERTMQSFALRSHPHGGFIPEDVHSSIPLALRKAELGDDADAAEDDDDEHGGVGGLVGGGGGGVGAKEARAHAHELALGLGLDGSGEETERTATQMCIVWRYGGRDVKLLRAGDNNWKGRTPMEYDEATNEWRAWVALMPGTHHIRFQVDGQVTTAEDLPTAVDDNGTIANYVAVPLSGNTPPSAPVLPTPTKENPNQLPPPISTAVGASFFADAQASANEDAAWTDRTPWQLECAAEEEETWLTHGQQARNQPPQHPQAPSLPRHLEKLIMNQKMPPGSGASRVGGAKSGPGVSSNRSGGGASGVGSVVGGQLPVVTASGTNLSAGSSGSGKGNSNNTAGVANFTTKEMYTKLVDAAGLADDGSVLPVPSHVVLHHLGTSAIRNGVLAVADTMRYKKKYITTIYYKPT